MLVYCAFRRSCGRVALGSPPLVGPCGSCGPVVLVFVVLVDDPASNPMLLLMLLVKGFPVILLMLLPPVFLEVSGMYCQLTIEPN